MFSVTIALIGLPPVVVPVFLFIALRNPQCIWHVNRVISDVVARQLQVILDAFGVGGLAEGVVAYEPVWAIGTGLTASPEQAQDVHAMIRARLAMLDDAQAQDVRIVYGGSVKADNAEALFSMPDIDGGLIGGASLNAEEFGAIARAAGRV